MSGSKKESRRELTPGQKKGLWRRVLPNEQGTGKHRLRSSRSRGFTEHVHQKLRLIRIDGIKPPNSEWYLCICGKRLLLTTICEVPADDKRRDLNHLVSLPDQR